MTVRQKLLVFLEQQQGQIVSGEELAGRLGVSRAAVWKGMNALKEQGYPIRAATKKGYWLEAGGDLLSGERIQSMRAPHMRALPVYKYDTVDSTNLYARKLASEGAGTGTLVVANTQTAGRGRMGNTFYSPPHTGLYLSAVLRPHARLTAVLPITAAAAVAVCETVEEICGRAPSIKWVNDLYWEGRKVCGILTEAVSDFESGMVESVVVGIGLNVCPPAGQFPKELREIAGALNLPGNTRCRLAAGIADRLCAWQKRLDDPALMDAYRARSMLLGHRVVYTQGDARQAGVVTGVSNEGYLLVKNADGTEQALRSGEVTVKEWDT